MIRTFWRTSYSSSIILAKRHQQYLRCCIQDEIREQKRYFNSVGKSSGEIIRSRSHQFTDRLSGIANSNNISRVSGIAVAVIGLGFAARLAYGHLLSNDDKTKHGPRRDGSKASVLVQTKAVTMADLKNFPKMTREAIGKSAGENNLQQVSADEFNAFMTEQTVKLRSARKRNRKVASEILHKELKNALSDASDRVSSFSNWYFAYSTTYKLLGIAMASATKHAVTFNKEQSLSAKVADELQAYVCRKYEALVLRPAVTNPKIHRAFVRCVQSSHDGYIEAIGDLERSVSVFVSEHATPYSSPPRSDDVVVDMDWSAQLQKVEHVPIAYEKTPEISLAIIGSGAVAGKFAGGAAMSAAAKGLASKLVAPFASKAAGLALGGTSGGVAAATAAATAAGGAVAAGPVGAAFGAAAGATVGLGVDMGVNAGMALMQKSVFEKDIHESLDATILEWEEKLLPELERVQDVWFDHVEELLSTPSSSTAVNSKSSIDKS